MESVAAGIGVEYAKVLELSPSGGALLLRSGIGWHEGLVGSATMGAGRESRAGYTLLSHEPVVGDGGGASPPDRRPRAAGGRAHR